MTPFAALRDDALPDHTTTYVMAGIAREQVCTYMCLMHASRR